MKITDEMLRAGVEAMNDDRFEGFSTPRDAPNGRKKTWGPPHYIRDFSLPGEPVIWRGNDHDEMMTRISMERLRLGLQAALSLTTHDQDRHG